MTQKRREIAEAISTSLMLVLEEFTLYNRGIPVGNADLQIVEVEFNGDEESHDDTLTLILSDGTTWEIRPQEVRSWPTAQS